MTAKWCARILVLALPALTGCQKMIAPFPAGVYGVTVEDLVANDSLLVKRVTVTAKGKMKVEVTATKDRATATVYPDPETGLMTADVMLVAALVATAKPEESRLLYLVQVKGRGGTASWTAQLNVPSDKSLADLLTVHVEPGQYTLGEGISLGTVRGDELILSAW